MSAVSTSSGSEETPLPKNTSTHQNSEDVRPAAMPNSKHPAAFQKADSLSAPSAGDSEKSIPTKTAKEKTTIPKEKTVPHKQLVTDLQQQLTALQQAFHKKEEEYKSLYDSYLREKADFDNYRKRLNREKEEMVAYANSQLLLDVVGVLDNFERAIHAAPEDQKDPNVLALFNGIALIEKEWISILEKKWGLKRLQTVGEIFDPNLHEAVAMEEKEGLESQTVVEEFQSGYLLHSRLLRSAKVKVHVPKNKTAQVADKE